MNSFISGDWLGDSEWARWTTAAGLLLILAGLVFASWWALFADRARGRRRCPRCWYDLAYTPGMTCPECGYTGRAETDFARTRRRWTLAILGIIASSLLGGVVIERANHQGWLCYAPTGVLIWTLPVGGDGNGPVLGELSRRAAQGDITKTQWLNMLRRAARGDAAAKPGSDRWAEKYGRIARTAAHLLRNHEDQAFRTQVTDALMAMPPRVTINTRPTWPQGIPITLDLAARHWWPGTVQIRLAARPALERHQPIDPDVHVLLGSPIQRRSYSLFLPPMKPGDYRIPIALTIDRRAAPDDPWQTVRSWEQQVSFTVEGRLADLVSPTSSEQLDQRIRDVFADSGLVMYRGGGSLPVRVGLNPRPTFDAAFDDTAVGLRIEVYRNDTLGRMLDIWWRAGSDAAEDDRQYAWEVPFLDDAVLGAEARDDDRWTLRIRGLPELALRVNDAAKYWAGQVEVPTHVRVTSGTAVSRGWIPAGDPVARAAGAHPAAEPLSPPDSPSD